MSVSVSWSKALAALVALLAGGLIGPSAFAAVSANPIFRSDMVLQRDMPCPVFGDGDVGSTVTVQFQDQTVSTVVGSSGKWQVNLSSMAASTSPSTMTVSATGSPTVTFDGVQVGEVWLFSGQSNMGLPMSRPTIARPTSPMPPTTTSGCSA